MITQQPTNVNYEELPPRRAVGGANKAIKHMVFETANRKAREVVLRQAGGYYSNYTRERQIWQDQMLSKVGFGFEIQV